MKHKNTSREYAFLMIDYISNGFIEEKRKICISKKKIMITVWRKHHM